MLKPYNSNELYFFVMRGVPGCGKSTFTAKYMTKVSNVIESDVIREKISGKIIRFMSDYRYYSEIIDTDRSVSRLS